MAISRTTTLLPLDEYARLMVMPGWLFNQVTHPMRQVRGSCGDIWYQSGYSSDPNRIVGRDEIAQAIAVAESQIAQYLGFWPAPKYTCGELIKYPHPQRGTYTEPPRMQTRWGHLISPGVETFELIAASVPIVYTDEDADGVFDTATITIHSLYAYEPEVADPCEVVVVPQGGDMWTQIRPLTITLTEVEEGNGTLTITGPRWMFVVPARWNTLDPLEMDDDINFLTSVDVYRRYTDTTTQANLIWKDVGCPPCQKLVKTGCMIMHHARVGLISVTAANYDAVTELWSRNTECLPGLPDQAEVWYLSGYDDNACEGCYQMGATMAEAIVRLANVHLQEAPCGCDATRERWVRDRTEVTLNTRIVAEAQRSFGTTMAGAVFALSSLWSIPALGKGG